MSQSISSRWLYQMDVDCPAVPSIFYPFSYSINVKVRSKGRQEDEHIHTGLPIDSTLMSGHSVYQYRDYLHILLHRVGYCAKTILWISEIPYLMYALVPGRNPTV